MITQKELKQDYVYWVPIATSSYYSITNHQHLLLDHPVATI